ncbi:MAG: class I SAM-dependent methyltransferase [Phycisphaeraceae bacterium]|nr:class I SAM-dependent methyltransferase [Phycisphaeraceae bacterium]
MTYIYQDGNRYDRMFHGEHDLEFWLSHARMSNSVLELACGTGRIAIPVARTNISVVGLDASKNMLAEAKEKSQAAGVRVEWVQADMRHFDLARKFSLVILANNSLCHLLTYHQLAECLACVRRHLEPQGKFIVDVFVPSLSILLRDATQRSDFSKFVDSDGCAVAVTSQNRYEMDTQINRVQIFAKDSQGKEETSSFDMRMYFPQELDALLGYNGFQVQSKFGDFDGQPFGPSSPKQIVVCTPTAQ